MRSRNLAWLFVLLAAACGGNTEGGPPTSTTPDPLPFGPQCVDISVSASDVACSVDQDCTFALTGHVCTGDCACATNADVNAAAASRIQGALSTLSLNQSCECGFPGYARCIGGQCTACPRQEGACMAVPEGDP